jgi:hypothetical protein
MSFFTSAPFWFIEGILATLTLIGFKQWMKDRNTPMPFWKWLVFCAWLLIVGFTIAFIGTSIGENEIVAAKKGGIIFFVVAVVTGAGGWQLLQIGRVTASGGVQAGEESEETAGDAAS